MRIKFNISCHTLYSCTLTIQKNCFTKVKTKKDSRYCCRESHRFWVKHKLDGERGFIFLSPQDISFPELDANCNGVVPASGFVIKNDKTTYFVSCPMQAVGHVIRTWSAVCSMPSQSSKY